MHWRSAGGPPLPRMVSIRSPARSKATAQSSRVYVQTRKVTSSVTFHPVIDGPIGEVVLTDSESGVRFIVNEAANVSQRMAHAEAEAAPWTEHPGRCSDGAWHVSHDLERVVGDREVETTVE